MHALRHSYGSAEERNSRAAIFAERLAVVKAHNANPAHSWKRGVNQLTDKTKGELRALHGLNRPMLYAEKQKQLEARLATGAAVKDAAATMSARKKLPDSLASEKLPPSKSGVFFWLTRVLMGRTDHP